MSSPARGGPSLIHYYGFRPMHREWLLSRAVQLRYATLPSCRVRPAVVNAYNPSSAID